ncbi:hypothetical protein ACI6QG_12510 [Roseococcus sp. DSY-14]|uniref:hypothetical protein n=1 Tax=Roseococcus sp. DSY-14 TaxID=3369650 RepID=UPI00387AB3C2
MSPLGETAAPWTGPLPPAAALAVHAAAPGAVELRWPGGRLALPGGAGWRFVALPAQAGLVLHAAAPLTRARGAARPLLRLFPGPLPPWWGWALPAGARWAGLPPRPLLRGPLDWPLPPLPGWRVRAHTLRGHAVLQGGVLRAAAGWEGVLQAEPGPDGRAAAAAPGA